MQQRMPTLPAGSVSARQGAGRDRNAREGRGWEQGMVQHFHKDPQV